MKVWIVKLRENAGADSSDIRGVFSTEEKALEYVNVGFVRLGWEALLSSGAWGDNPLIYYADPSSPEVSGRVSIEEHEVE